MPNNCNLSCLKINNPIRNLLLPAIVFIVIEKLFGYLFYMSLFKDIWMQYESLYRPMSDSKYWCVGMLLVSSFYALLISFFYIKICNLAKKRICLSGFAFAIFLIGRFTGEIYGYLMYPYNFQNLMLGMSHGFVTIFFWALISKKIFLIKE